MTPVTVTVRVGALRRVDLSLIVLLLVLALFGAGIWQLARAFPDAHKGLVIYAREQKDLFIDAGLINESYRVRNSSPLTRRLRSQTVIVAVRTSDHSAYVGAGVIIGAHARRIEILTAKHIVAHPGPKLVIFPDHVIRPVTRMIAAQRRDLAEVFVDAVPLTEYPAAHLAQQTFHTGEQFVVMGHPGAQSWTASPGVAERHLHGTLLFCPTCDRGDSGAGAFDRSGVLHGIVVTKTVMVAPSASSGRYFKLTAFEIEEPEAIRAFLRTRR